MHICDTVVMYCPIYISIFILFVYDLGMSKFPARGLPLRNIGSLRQSVAAANLSVIQPTYVFFYLLTLFNIILVYDFIFILFVLVGQHRRAGFRLCSEVLRRMLTCVQRLL